MSCLLKKVYLIEGLCPIAEVNGEAEVGTPVAVADGNSRKRRNLAHLGYFTRGGTPECTYVSSKANLNITVHNHEQGSGGIGKEKLKCSYCGYEFSAKSNLRRHVRDHHQSNDPSAALCPVCGKNCRNRSNVLTHMYRVHHVTARQLNAGAQSYTARTQQPFSSTSEDHMAFSGHQNLGHLTPHSTVVSGDALATGNSQDMSGLSQEFHAYNWDSQLQPLDSQDHSV